MPARTNSAAPGTGLTSTFGSLLRSLRQRHSLSQVELAARAGSTPRYISFIETGRSRPGRDLIERISDTLDVPLRDRAELLRAAGLTSTVTEHRLSDTELDAHRIAIEHLLSSHEPYPACAMDPCGRVLALNRPCALLNPGIEALTPEALVDAAVGPGPVRDAIVNFPEVAHAYTDRLERRARAGTDPKLRALADRAHRHVADIPRPRHDATNATLRIQLRVDDRTTLSMLAAIVRFEHATDITVAELWVELLFPTDDDTRRWFEATADPTANRSERATPARGRLPVS
jgi:transcriptional regulator with XRE-family HTH domain